MVLRRPLRGLGFIVLAALALGGEAVRAQPAAPAGGETVTWTAPEPGGDSVKPGGRALLTLRGTVRPGWHVYGLNQAPTGPTPLRVAVEANETARADGAPKGSPPVKEHSRAFDADTEFYATAFTVTAPVRIAAHAAAGRQQVPVSVQFQTCNGDICQPPKTVRVLAAVNIKAGG